MKLFSNKFGFPQKLQKNCQNICRIADTQTPSIQSLGCLAPPASVSRTFTLAWIKKIVLAFIRSFEFKAFILSKVWILDYWIKFNTLIIFWFQDFARSSIIGKVKFFLWFFFWVQWQILEWLSLLKKVCWMLDLNPGPRTQTLLDLFISLWWKLELRLLKFIIQE